jgi:hypothetical protein
VNQLIFIGVLGAAAATGFILRYRGMNWFVAWLVASMVIPSILYVSELVQPTGWLGVAVVFGGVYGIALGGAGVLAGWFATRRPNGHAAP